MNDYQDIINLEHHVSSKHKKMSIDKRAGIFAPFKALDGLDLELKESEKRYTMKKVLSAEQKEILNNKLLILKDNLGEEIDVVYFKKEKNEAGKYYKKKGSIKKIDIYNETILLDKELIKMDDIYDIKSNLFV